VADPDRGAVPDEPGRRRFKGDRRDDYAMDLFREALANLADAGRVDRVLGALGRVYNPLVDAAIVDLATRQQVAGLLEEGRAEEARALIEARMALYAPSGGEGGPGSG
jgi:hypothetical protein